MEGFKPEIVKRTPEDIQEDNLHDIASLLERRKLVELELTQKEAELRDIEAQLKALQSETAANE